MNKLTQREFEDRTQAVARARRIFINLTGGNITDAFILYQEVLAEQERGVIINTLMAGTRTRTLFDNFDRPKCPTCGTPMMFRPVATNDEGVKVQLVCENQACDTVLDSDKDLNEWAEELRKEMNDGREQVTEAEQEGPGAGE